MKKHHCFYKKRLNRQKRRNARFLRSVPVISNMIGLNLLFQGYRVMKRLLGGVNAS